MLAILRDQFASQVASIVISGCLGSRFDAYSSSKSHAELDDSPGLDEGNPAELGAHYRAILERFPRISVLGGGCGTDARHVRQIAEACAVH